MNLGGLQTFSGVQTGVAPGVAVDHAASGPSEFDSQRAHSINDN